MNCKRAFHVFNDLIVELISYFVPIARYSVEIGCEMFMKQLLRQPFKLLIASAHIVIIRFFYNFSELSRS